jgi:cytochrome bd-type quinol oxidase subunit 1
MTPPTRTIGEPIEWDWYFVKRRHLPIARRGLSIALGVLAVILPLQGFIGDSVVAYVAKYKTPQFEAQEGNLEAQHRMLPLLIGQTPTIVSRSAEGRRGR